MPTSTKRQLKRLNLALPDVLYQSLEEQAAIQQTSITELLRRYIRLGTTADRLIAPGGTLLVREGDTKQEHVLAIV